MDPIANIKEQRVLARHILEKATEADMHHVATTLAELVIDLDEWRSKGGFDPYDQREQDAPREKLTPAEVAAIRASANTQSTLAERYGVTQGHISRIKHRQTWR